MVNYNYFHGLKDMIKNKALTANDFEFFSPTV